MEYELTDGGDAEFLRLLRAALAGHDQKIDELTAGVGFLDSRPRHEAITLLKQRLAALEGWREEVAHHWTPENENTHEWEPTIEILRLWTNYSASGCEWTRSLLERLERDRQQDQDTEE